MKLILLFCSCILLFSPAAGQAKSVIFEEKYTYDASEADSKLTCRAISLLQAKKLLLEKLGTYLEAETEIVNFQLTRDQVTTLTAGIVKTEIVDEIWDGKTYSLTARIEADPDAIAKSIDKLRKSRKVEKSITILENLNEKSMGKIKDLKNELERIQNNLIDINRDYSVASKVMSAWDLYEAGLQRMREKRYNDALSAFSKAIEIQPKYTYFFQRGKTYSMMKQYHNAIHDFDKVLILNSAINDAYFRRGRAYRRIGKKEKGLQDIREAAELGNGNAKRWLKLKGKM